MANPHPNQSGLKRTAGPGRPKGSKNKITKAIDDFFGSSTYQDNAKQRMLDGKAPHLETYFLNKIEGKPVEIHQHEGADGGPVRVEFVIVNAS